MSQKVCFLLRIEPTSIDEYVERHRAVWPEMLDALAKCGYRNYSVFVDSTGLLVGYLETDNFARSAQLMSQTEAQQAWDKYMNNMFREVDDLRPVGTITPLLHAFDLDEQRQRRQMNP